MTAAGPCDGWLAYAIDDLKGTARGFDCDIAGLFEGYGGLTMGAQAAIGGELGWYSEIEPAACRLLKHHYPDVPNFGDITAVDWAATPRPRVLTGGFPCQDVSSAGRRAGLNPDTRSGLWNHMATAIDRLRPELVVIENVRGLLSAHADSAMEPCPWCVGNGPGSGLRALGAVLGDLVDLGYDARWCGLRAADVGAPHGRFRIFIAASPANAGSFGWCPGAGGGVRGVAAVGSEAGQDADYRGGVAAANTYGYAVREQPVAECGSGSTPQLGQLGVVRRAADAHPDSTGCEGAVRQVAATIGQREAPHGPRAAATERGGAAPDALCDGREGRQERHIGSEGGQSAPLGGDAAGRVLEWGVYTPAIRRWEHQLGRLAPAPTMTGKRGGQQLSPLFVEWMQGLPEGHVTGVPGLSRNEQLKLLGNGVVSQQAEAALRYLLTSVAQAVAA